MSSLLRALQHEEEQLCIGFLLIKSVKSHCYSNSGRGALGIEKVEISLKVGLRGTPEVVENVGGDRGVSRDDDGAFFCERVSREESGQREEKEHHF